MNTNRFEEIYGSEARIQLSFKSYMKMGLLISCVFSVVLTLSLLNIMTTTSVVSENEISMESWLTFVSAFGGFSICMLSTALSFPIYSYIYSKEHGQKVNGKFAILVDRSKSL